MLLTRTLANWCFRMFVWCSKDTYFLLSCATINSDERARLQGLIEFKTYQGNAGCTACPSHMRDAAITSLPFEVRREQTPFAARLAPVVGAGTTPRG